ncbi:MAG: exodeoxyribonuclease III [Alphaproteobacteria bacterium]|nr:exodeoxyribonuclease III [Alphaproteobacteria bacterium]
MKIASYNVNSVRQRLPNLQAYLEFAKPDVICLQELKCMEDQFPMMEVTAAGYQAVMVGQKSYNGVTILSKTAASVVQNTIGDEQARYLEVDVGGVRIINIYAPNGNPLGTEKFTYKLDWLSRLEARMKVLLADEVPFAVLGDYNIIPEARDAHNPSAWLGDALYQPESRAMYRRFINLGLTDAFRLYHPDADAYTFWDYQAASWAKNDGIRIDHVLLSPQLADKCMGCEIDREERGRENPSDHVPIAVTLKVQ